MNQQEPSADNDNVDNEVTVPSTVGGAEVVASVSELVEILTKGPLLGVSIGTASPHTSMDAQRGLRKDALEHTVGLIASFIEASGPLFRFRQPSFLRETLDDLARAIEELDDAFCQATASDAVAASESIRQIPGLPDEIVQRQMEKAVERIDSQHQVMKQRLMELLADLQEWVRGVTEEARQGI